ncbi:MAG TPA: methyltransferase [Mycobacteriales bacterium]|nr:methyltransferase [Mycobacteriales bacterium]
MLPTGPDHPPGLSGLRVAFHAAGYRPPGVQSLLGLSGEVGVTPAELVIHERRLASNAGPLADLVALLTLGAPVPTARAAAALGVAGLDALVKAGALVEDADSVRPEVRLMPHGDVWLASDLRTAPGAAADRWHVTSINAPATLLAAMTVRRDDGRGLDIGTGNGIQAILLSQHCTEVTATDVNPRALRFAQFNAVLNGCANIDFRLGDLFEPVAGERFDVVVSNPPYVISPENEVAFRDSGQEPGALCAELVGAVPSHLAADGYATVLASWPVSPGRSWVEVPAGWLGGDCEAWLLQFSADDPLRHAREWNSPLALAGDLDGFAAAVDRWVSYADSHDIDLIGYGAVLVHQRPGPAAVVRADQVRIGYGTAGGQIQRVFAANRDLARLGEDLSDLRCSIAEEHRVQRAVRYVDGEWASGESSVTLDAGVGLEVGLDPVLGEVFFELAAGRSLSEAVADVGLRADLADAELDRLAAAGQAVARQLVSLGILIPR